MCLSSTMYYVVMRIIHFTFEKNLEFLPLKVLFLCSFVRFLKTLRNVIMMKNDTLKCNNMF